MKRTLKMAALVLIFVLVGLKFFIEQSTTPPVDGPHFEFIASENAIFTEEQKAVIIDTTKSVIDQVRKSFPVLSDKINFTILMVDRDLTIVKGVTGRADRRHEIEISISSEYKGGVDQAITDGLESTLFHELHHVVRGWLVEDNKFARGIDIAAINEGLADVFAEMQVGHLHGNYTGSPDFDAWTKEILALPVSANYGEWMFVHPDGRFAIGYRTGAWVVKKAMQASGKNIIELSTMTIGDIYSLAGYTFRGE